MAKKQPSKQLKIDERKGQVSAIGGQLNNFFLRNVPLWNTPVWQEAEFWRKFVSKQQIAILCRERIGSYLNSLDWHITPRDPEQRDELKRKIRYYTKLFEKGSSYYNDLDFSSHIEWITKDLYDLPFGAASELGRIDDNPNGRVVWIRPIDGGTLAPTLNFDFPVVQQSVSTGLTPIYIPKDFVSRVYLSPRTELRREGWGLCPPEKIYLAIEMLSRGDEYYAQLLLNTPEAGILDLGDMEKSSALEWVQSLRDLLYGVNPLKIPVLYEHTANAKFIPFGRPPSEIMYDSISMKYAAIVCAGYGLTLADIGLAGSGGAGAGGDTLAGTIRSERTSKSSGFSTAKKKIASYFNSILPDTIQFGWIDYDDEKNVSKGRARVASAQASDIWIRNKVFLPSEVRQQMLADGLISITVPETIDPNDPEFESSQPEPKPNFGGSRTKENNGGVAPSNGGHGEVIPQQVVQRNMTNAEICLSKAVFNVNNILSVLLSQVQNNLSQAELDVWSEYVDDYLVGRSEIEEEKLAEILTDIQSKSSAVVETQPWAKEFSGAIAKKVFEDTKAEETSRLMFQKAEAIEQDYIAGKRDNALMTDEDVDIQIDRAGLEEFTQSKFTDVISRYIVLISKSEILDGKLDVDATEATSENIRVSRTVSKEVLRSLTDIANEVYSAGKKFLQEKIVENGEKDAVS